MSAQHTQGPWRTDPEVGHESVIDSDGRMVADCAIFGAGFTKAKNKANACLIDAAPDLMEALAMLLDQCERVGMTTRDEEPFLEAARAAIAKATGQKGGA